MPLLFALAVLLPLEAYLRGARTLQGEIVAGAIALSLLAQLFRKQAKHPLAEWALALSGGLYVSLLLSYFVLLRMLPNGMFWIFLLLICVWTCDSCAYLAGSNFGRHGFFTHISPKKTVEGAVGGILAGSVAAFAGVPLLGIPLAHALPLGLAMSVAATFGDLAESLIKRQLKVKDSGNTIPGHGGFLDRIDSLLLPPSSSTTTPPGSLGFRGNPHRPPRQHRIHRPTDPRSGTSASGPLRRSRPSPPAPT